MLSTCRTSVLTIRRRSSWSERSTAVDSGQVTQGVYRLHHFIQKGIFLWSVSSQSIDCGSLLLVDFWWESTVWWEISTHLDISLLLSPLRRTEYFYVVTVTGSCSINTISDTSSKVGQCACGPPDLFDLGCGIRITLVGVRDRQLFPYQFVKETRYLVSLLISSHERRCTE